MVGMDSTGHLTNGLSVASMEAASVSRPPRQEQQERRRLKKKKTQDSSSSQATSSSSSPPQPPQPPPPPQSKRIKKVSIVFAFVIGLIAWILFCATCFLCTSFYYLDNYRFGFWMREDDRGHCISFDVPDDVMFIAGRLASLVGLTAGGIFVLMLGLMCRRFLCSNAASCRIVGAGMIFFMSSTVVCCSFSLRSEFCEGNCAFTTHGILLHVSALFWIISGVILFSVHDYVETAKTRESKSPVSITTKETGPDSAATTKSGSDVGIYMIKTVGSEPPSVFAGTVGSRESLHATPLGARSRHDMSKELSAKLAMERRKRLHEITQSIFDEVPLGSTSGQVEDTACRGAKELGQAEDTYREAKDNDEEMGLGGFGEEEKQVCRDNSPSSAKAEKIFVYERERVRPEMMPHVSMSSAEDSTAITDHTPAESTYFSEESTDYGGSPPCSAVSELLMFGDSTTKTKVKSVPSTIAFHG